MLQKLSNNWAKQFCLGLQTSLVVLWVTIGFQPHLFAQAQQGPSWWYSGDFSIVTGEAQSNLSPTNLGQAKNVVLKTLAALDASGYPSAAGKIRADLVGPPIIFNVIEPKPESPDDAWYQQQSAPLLVGQLKALAYPFFKHFNDELGVEWVSDYLVSIGFPLDLADEELIHSDYINPSDGRAYPWTHHQDDDSNSSPANIGQLKACFAFPLQEDSDNDGIFDILEYRVINQLPRVQSLSDINEDNASDLFSEAGFSTGPQEQFPERPTPREAEPEDSFMAVKEAFAGSRYVVVSLLAQSSVGGDQEGEFRLTGLSDNGEVVVNESIRDISDEFHHPLVSDNWYCLNGAGQVPNSAQVLATNEDVSISNMNINRGGHLQWYVSDSGEGGNTNLFTGVIQNGQLVENGARPIRDAGFHAELADLGDAIAERASLREGRTAVEVTSVAIASGISHHFGVFQSEDGNLLDSFSEGCQIRASYNYMFDDSILMKLVMRTGGELFGASSSDYFYGGVPLRDEADKMDLTMSERYRSRHNIGTHRSGGISSLWGRGQNTCCYISYNSDGVDSEHYFYFPERDVREPVPDAPTDYYFDVCDGNSQGHALAFDDRGRYRIITNLVEESQPIQLEHNSGERLSQMNDRLDILGSDGSGACFLRRPFRARENSGVEWVTMDIQDAVDRTAGEGTWTDFDVTHLSNAGETTDEFRWDTQLPKMAGIATKDGVPHVVLLLPVEFKDYFGGSLFSEREPPKCCSEKVAQNMLTHLYPNKGSEMCLYLHPGDSFDVSVLIPDVPSLKYELIYEFFGDELDRKEFEGDDEIQVIEYTPTLNPLLTVLSQFGFELSVHLLITDEDGAEVLKSPDLKFLVDDANLRNAFFKEKVDPFSPGWKGKGSYSELLMGMMLHEVSLEIVKLVEENTVNHTRDPVFDLQDPRATQGTNREIIKNLGDQIGKAGSDWDKAADSAVEVELAAWQTALDQITVGNLVGAENTIISAIFHVNFNEFEKIENKFRGQGWGKYGCPCGGDNDVLKAASLRGVNSPEVLQTVARYSPSAAFGIAVLPQSFVEGYMQKIQDSKVGDLQNNFEESWMIGGCCE